MMRAAALGGGYRQGHLAIWSHPRLAGDGRHSRYIATHKDKDGNLPIKDDKTGRDLAARICRDPQPVRHLREGEYFICTDFRKPGSRTNITTSILGEPSRQAQVDNVKVLESRCRKTACGRATHLI